MPKLWRYLLFSYLQVFFFTVCCFIAILFVSRFKDVARFAAVTADWGKTALFMAYQVPAVLPMAVPIAALLASLMLLRRLDRGSELTALRSSGIGFRMIFAPLGMAAVFLGICHFSLCAEVTPWCRRESRALLYRETSANPLLLLQRQRLVKIPDIFLKMKVREEGRAAHDFLLAGYNRACGRIGLVAAERLKIEGERLWGEEVVFVVPLQEGGLLIENQVRVSMEAPVLSAAIKKNRPSIDATVLNLRMLRLRGEEEGKSGRAARVEILRRVSLSLSVVTFTLLGFAFGIESRRVWRGRGVVKAVILAGGVLVSYLLGRVLKQDFALAAGAYLLPHVVVWLCSGVHLWKVGRGRG